MKTKTSTISMILLSAAALAVPGCQQANLIFGRADALRLRQTPPVRQSQAVVSPAGQSRAVLIPVRTAAIQEDSKTEPVVIDPPKTEVSTPDASETAEPVSDSTVDQAHSAVTYTAPPAWVRQLVVLVGSIGLTDGASDAGAGKEVSESVIYSTAGVVGRPGLSSPGTTVGGAVVGRIGTNAGGAGAIGIGSSNNVHTLQRNPATGPGGRCDELVRAGLISDHAACVRGGRRR
jgi:hypothetical protein